MTEIKVDFLKVRLFICLSGSRKKMKSKKLTMRKTLLILLATVLFTSCSQKNDQIPEKIFQFSEKAIGASISTYPLKDFYNDTYFNENVPKEYLNRLNANAIIWKGIKHNTELREANLINQNGENSEYLLKYWVTFKEDSRKFSYSINVLDKEGKMTLTRFEPLNVNIASTFYSPDNKFNIPNFDSNRTKIYFTYTSIFVTLLIIIVLAIWKRKYLLLLSIPLLFVYKQGISVYSYKGIDILSPKTNFGLPLFENIDLHFTSISLTTTGVFYVWAIIGLFMIFSIKRNKNTYHNTV